MIFINNQSFVKRLGIDPLRQPEERSTGAMPRTRFDLNPQACYKYSFLGSSCIGKDSYSSY